MSRMSFSWLLCPALIVDSRVAAYNQRYWQPNAEHMNDQAFDNRRHGESGPVWKPELEHYQIHEKIHGYTVEEAGDNRSRRHKAKFAARPVEHRCGGGRNEEVNHQPKCGARKALLVGIGSKHSTRDYLQNPLRRSSLNARIDE